MIFPFRSYSLSVRRSNKALSSLAASYSLRSHPESSESSKASPQRLQKVGTMLVVPDVTAMLFQLKLRTYLDPKMLYERLVTYFTLPVNRSKKANRKLLIDRSPNLTISDVSTSPTEVTIIIFIFWSIRYPCSARLVYFRVLIFLLIFSKSLSIFFFTVTYVSHLTPTCSLSVNHHKFDKRQQQ